jgi:hypothetical protein
MNLDAPKFYNAKRLVDSVGKDITNICYFRLIGDHWFSIVKTEYNRTTVKKFFGLFKREIVDIIEYAQFPDGTISKYINSDLRSMADFILDKDTNDEWVVTKLKLENEYKGSHRYFSPGNIFVLNERIRLWVD